MEPEEASLFSRARELFAELMDRSELQVDLAYTALLFNDRTIAEDVTELHAEIEKMYIEFEENILRMAKLVESPEKLWSLMRTGDSVKEIADAALMLAETVLRGLPTHPVLQAVFESSSETVRKIPISKDSQLENKTLGDIKLQLLTGMRVICVKRGEKWIYGPDKNFEIKGGDVLFVRGPPEGEHILRSLASSPF